MTTTRFIHLHLHTEYSIADSIVRIEQLFPKCLTHNMPAVALTDQSNLFALVKFYKAAVSVGIKPIIGADLWLENPKEDAPPFKIVLLAQNYDGYQNLVQLISRSYIVGQHKGVPLIKRTWLEELNSGLLMLSGAKWGDVGQALLHDNMEQATNLAKFWSKHFPGRYYIELQRTAREREEEYLALALNVANTLHLPVVATNDVCFLEQQDFEAHEARVCIHSGHILNDTQRPRFYSDKQYLRSTQEMEELFHDIPESIINTEEIAKRCNLELSFDETKLPIFPVPAKTIPEAYFAKEARLGLQRRMPHKNNTEYIKRLEYEIVVINQMGFASYFLIVADFIRWSKNNAIPVGPGRGSGAGSLVAFALGITDLDPIEHGLLFERFLNPERVSLPDFDIDFCMDGRDRVIAYVVNRYGKERVAQVITYGTMAARAVVRDVGRVLGYPYGYVDKLAKLVPFALGISLERALADEELLRQRYKQEEEVKTLFDLAQKLEGIVRNAGKHAAGVVIAPSSLTDFMPLYCETEGGSIITQLDKDDVGTMGLVKFDFLGLRTLTIIDWTLKSIKQRHNKEIIISQLPLDDKATYELLQTGKTAAIFQLESRISRDLIRRFQPDCFNDIVALVAIIRPGVLQSGMLDEIIDRKHGRAPITYLHPKLEPILGPTYGVAIYQEQVMQMAQSLAGYNLGNADLLRRAMGKKKPEEMAKQRTIFIEGAVTNNIDKHLANVIFDFMEKFASYGFNKSHSAAYALISYQTAWLKTYYPAEFMAAVLSSGMENTDKVVVFLRECKDLGIQFMPPDINYSHYMFVVSNDDKILYGLGAIKGVGQAAVEVILEARKQGGAFKDLFDLCSRIDTRKVNKRVLEALVRAGAMDNIGPDRASQMATIETALSIAAHNEKSNFLGQVDLFDELPDDELAVSSTHKYTQAQPWSTMERLRYEKELLGFYLTGHPFTEFAAELRQFVHHSVLDLVPEIGKATLIAGFIRETKVVNTKSGKRLAIFTLEDDTASIEASMFAENFMPVHGSYPEDEPVVIEGEVGVDTFTDKCRVRAMQVMSLDQARAHYVKGLLLRVNAKQLSKTILYKLYDILKQYRGNKCQVFIVYDKDSSTTKLTLGKEWCIEPKGKLLLKLKENLPAISASFVY